MVEIILIHDAPHDHRPDRIFRLLLDGPSDGSGNCPVHGLGIGHFDLRHPTCDEWIHDAGHVGFPRRLIHQPTVST